MLSVKILKKETKMRKQDKYLNYARICESIQAVSKNLFFALFFLTSIWFWAIVFKYFSDFNNQAKLMFMLFSLASIVFIMGFLLNIFFLIMAKNIKKTRIK